MDLKRITEFIIKLIDLQEGVNTFSFKSESFNLKASIESSFIKIFTILNVKL